MSIEQILDRNLMPHSLFNFLSFEKAIYIEKELEVISSFCLYGEYTTVQCRLQKYKWYGNGYFLARGSQREVVYFGWPITPSYMSPNGGRGGCAVSVNGYSCAHGAQINFGVQAPCLTYVSSLFSGEERGLPFAPQSEYYLPPCLSVYREGRDRWLFIQVYGFAPLNQYRIVLSTSTVQSFFTKFSL